MKTVIVWLLITVSDGASNQGNVRVVERFPTSDACEFVRKNIPPSDKRLKNSLERCIQATIVVPTTSPEAGRGDE